LAQSGHSILPKHCQQIGKSAMMEAIDLAFGLMSGEQGGKSTSWLE
jgi:hypothetical protein